MKLYALDVRMGCSRPIRTIRERGGLKSCGFGSRWQIQGVFAELDKNLIVAKGPGSDQGPQQKARPLNAKRDR